MNIPELQVLLKYYPDTLVGATMFADGHAFIVDKISEYEDVFRQTGTEHFIGGTYADGTYINVLVRSDNNTTVGLRVVTLTHEVYSNEH